MFMAQRRRSRGGHGARGTGRILAAALLAAASCSAMAEQALPRTALRVCADPFNLPMSNREGEGYENKLAELFGQRLSLPVVYEWFPQRIGFIRNTLRNNETEDGSYKCDLVMGVIENFELAATTRPYLHSSWALVYVKGRGLDYIKSQDDLKNLSDEQKAALRIGVWDRGPGTDFVFQNGLMEQATPFQSMSGDARENPGKIISRDLVEDHINLTFVWGPIAGYYAKQIKDQEIVVIPMRNEPGLRFDFQISMAVRFGEKAWKDQVSKLIADNQGEIDTILADYGVPMLPLVLRGSGSDDDDDD
ncbi:MAG: quinoprotein dehydrogenase-associated putative ABC transporter substrate-binding protein [Gammaproteobacteria bacterium]|nr:quinoprotein dehydrogenase-associated putative ABC transporter substrate-binding protein [Gammaproteobacteria bacterium]